MTPFFSVLLSFSLLFNINPVYTQNSFEYCLEGRDGWNWIINGRYEYVDSYQNISYFRNTYRNVDEYGNIFLYSYHNVWFIGHNYTTDTHLYAFCERSQIEDCNDHWTVYDGEHWEPTPAVVYFGSDCDYARFTPLLCTENTDNIYITVVFDNFNLSGIYDTIGCYDGKPYLQRKTSSKNRSINIYISRQYSKYILAESESFMDDISSNATYATCDINQYPSVEECIFVSTEARQHTVPLPFDVMNNGDHGFNYFMIVSLPLSIVYIATVFIMIFVIVKCKDKASGEYKIRKKCAPKFIAKCVFAWIAKPAIEVYDYYTDIVLSISWLHYYAFDGKCPIDYSAYAYSLIVCSSLGFVLGVSGHCYAVFHSYVVDKRLSYQSLTDLQQSSVIYCAFGKMIIEDMIAIIIMAVFSEREVGVKDSRWIYAFYSSCISFMISAIKLIKRHTEDPPITDANKFNMLVLLVAIAILGGFILPLLIGYKFESFEELQLGFALNDNECQIFSDENVGVNEPIVFDVEQNDGYYVACGHIRDERSESVAGNGEVLYGGYISGLYCGLYDSDVDDGDSVLCEFTMFEGECWSGNCEGYNTHLEICFAYIGFQLS